MHWQYGIYNILYKCKYTKEAIWRYVSGWVYEKEDGDIPVEKFLNSLDIKMRNKILMILNVLQERGNQLREPYSKHLEDGIFEVRGKVGNDISRVLYFFYYNGKIIMTNGFIKKTQKHRSLRLN